MAESAVAAPPVAPVEAPVNTPNAPRTTGTDSLRAAIRNFGDKLKSGEVTLTDDGARTHDGATPATLTEVADGAPDGAAQDAASDASTGPVQGADGKWRNPDGSFARDPATPAPEPQAEPDATNAPATEPDAETVPFVLKGLADRGETDEEIDVPKPLEERFRRLTNDANRFREISKRIDTIEAKEADFQILEAKMRVAPDAFVLERLSPEVQQRLAVQLVAEHWDAIVKDLVKFDTDPSARLIAAKDNQIRLRDGQRAMEQETTRTKAAVRYLRMIHDAIPDGAASNRAARFEELAKIEVDRLYQANRGQIPTPDQITTLLASVATDMGFAAPAPTGNGQQPAHAPTQQNGSQPVAPPAKAQGTTRTSTVADRKAAQQRSRSIARRIAPAGAGGAPTMAPSIPPTSQEKGTNPLKERFAFLRANPGILRNVDANG